MMRKVMVFLAMLLIISGSVTAQNEVTIYNESPYSVDHLAVQQAAQPLVDAGAQVAVFLVNANGSTTDFLRRLQADELGNGVTANDNVIAIYVSFEPHYAELRWGGNYDRSLESVARTIRESQLNPHLRERQITEGIVSTLNAIESALAGQYSAGGTNVIVNLFNQIRANANWQTILIVGVILYLLFGGLFRRRRRGGSSSTTDHDWHDSGGGGFFGGFDGGDSGGDSGGGGSDGGDW